MQLVFRQQIGKHVPVATNTTIKLLLKMVFSNWSMQRGRQMGQSSQVRDEFCKAGREEMAL
jgi:membrane-anchored protein YejM (alkaline phosphatase superfamily)